MNIIRDSANDPEKWKHTIHLKNLFYHLWYKSKYSNFNGEYNSGFHTWVYQIDNNYLFEYQVLFFLKSPPRKVSS